MAKSSHDLLRDKSFNKVDIMLGSMENEGVIFLLVMFAGLENENHVMLNKTTYDVLLPLLLRHPEKANPAVLDAIRLLYVDWEHVDNEDADYLDALCQMLGDHIFVCPADVAARAHYAAGQSVYLYHMTHTPARNVYQVAWAETAFHGDDIPFVFGYHFLPGIWMGRQDGEDVVVQWPMPEVEVQLSLEIMKYWTNFAKTG
ncbi:acetylcholinesterase-like [Saccoglossus kowalevskii]